MLSKRGKDKRARDKDQSRRLYLALHHRNPNADDPSPISYSILISDKSHGPDTNTTTRYRIAREESLTDDIGLLEWAFIAQNALSTRSIRALSLMLLGKISPEISSQSVEEILAAVKVNQAELAWSASPWMLGALSALQQAGLIPSEPNPTTILANATKFARDHGYNPGVAAVPTCGINGEEMSSEVAKPNST